MSYLHQADAPRPATDACAVEGFDCFIGVEFEYLIPFIPSGTDDPEPNDTRYVVNEDVDGRNDEYSMERKKVVLLANKHLQRQFRAAGLPALVDDVTAAKFAHLTDPFDETEKYFVDQATKQGVPIPSDLSTVEHQFWRLSTDGSVEHDKAFTDAIFKERYNWVVRGFTPGMELASPVLRASTGAAAISTALHTMRRSLRFVVPRTAGFHVHLSSLDGGVDLLTAKKMITLVMMCEGMIYKLTAPWRIKSKYSQSLVSALVRLEEDRMGRKPGFGVYPGETEEDLAAMAARRDEHLKEMYACLPWPLRQSEKRHEGLEALWASVEHSELRLRYCGVAVKRKGGKPTAEDPEAGLYTVEMRQFEGMADPTTACAWVRFCVALFRIASTYDTESYRVKITQLDDMLDLRYNNPANSFVLYSCSLAPFMQVIGIPDTVEFWRRKIQRDMTIPSLEQNAMVLTRLIPPLIW